MQRFVATFLTSFALFSGGCAGSIESAVVDASEASTIPSGLVVTYDDRAPLLGGDRIEILADGSVRWWSDVPSPIDAGSAPEDAFDDVHRMPEAPSREPERTGTVDAAALRALLALLVSIEPWDSSPDDEDDSRLERRRAFLSITRGNERVGAWQWADPTETGDDRITSVRQWADQYVPRPAPVVVEETPEDENDGPNPLLTNP